MKGKMTNNMHKKFEHKLVPNNRVITNYYILCTAKN